MSYPLDSDVQEDVRTVRRNHFGFLDHMLAARASR